MQRYISVIHHYKAANHSYTFSLLLLHIINKLFDESHEYDLAFY
jgi:hypothetical protein